MADAEITIFQEGKAPVTVVRPVHCDGSVRYITYKRQKWPLNSRNEVYLDPPRRATAATEAGDDDVAPVAARNAGFEWDPEQKAVVSAPAQARILVDAGPGTGKTAVACGRVAQLIGAGVAPANILLISFTRTAVTEIRDRITAMAGGVDGAHAVAITTLDSHAWKILSGFDTGPRENLFRSFEDNIAAAIALLQSEDEAFCEYLSEVRHLIVDEAQDFVGSRADLVEAIVKRLHPECGVTIFSDDAQAIYGFADDDDDHAGNASGSLSARLRRSSCGANFEEMHLRRIYRTSSRSLVKIFTRVRQLVLAAGRDGLTQIRGGIMAAADGSTSAKEAGSVRGEDVLVLYRRRGDVLQDSSFRFARDEPHRIRMSGLPRPMFPWIAVLLSDWTASHLTLSDFDALCRERIELLPSAARPDPDEAWKKLFQLGGDRRTRRIEVRRLRARLSGTQPPLGLFSPDLGWEGPIVGTIHGSKGREAREVHLMLPKESDGYGDPEEESRVLFVGATRARSMLKVGAAPRCFARRKDRRVFATKMKGWPRVEIGRDDDVDVGLQVSESVYPHASDALAVQDRLRTLVNKHVSASARANAAASHRYEVRLADEPHPLAVLSQQVNRDLVAIARDPSVSRSRLKPPAELKYLNIVGVRTVVLAADDPRCQQLHAPFRKTGIFLSPVIFAFTLAAFERY